MGLIFKISNLIRIYIGKKTVFGGRKPKKCEKMQKKDKYTAAFFNFRIDMAPVRKKRRFLEVENPKKGVFLSAFGSTQILAFFYHFHRLFS